jgi:hypothetical protein
MNDQNGRTGGQNRVMTALVPNDLFQEFNLKRRRLGKSISEVQREMIRDWLATQRDLEMGAVDLEARREELSGRIKRLSGNIHHMDAYMRLFREQGGDTNEFSDAETILERMRPALEAFQVRKEHPNEIEFCDACMDEAHHDFAADRHLEIDWLRFRGYVLLNNEYCKLKRKLVESRHF